MHAVIMYALHRFRTGERARTSPVRSGERMWLIEVHGIERLRELLSLMQAEACRSSGSSPEEEFASAFAHVYGQSPQEFQADWLRKLGLEPDTYTEHRVTSCRAVPLG